MRLVALSFPRAMFHADESRQLIRGGISTTERYNRGLSSQALETSTAQDYAYQ